MPKVQTSKSGKHPSVIEGSERIIKMLTAMPEVERLVNSHINACSGHASPPSIKVKDCSGGFIMKIKSGHWIQEFYVKTSNPICVVAAIDRFVVEHFV